MQQGGKIAAAVAVYEGGTQIYEKTMAWWQNRFSYTVTVSEIQPFYSDVHDWLVEAIPDEKNRKLTILQAGYDSVSSSNMAVPEDSSGGDLQQKPTIKLRYDDSRPRTVFVDGHRVRVHINNPDAVSGNQSTAGVIRFEPKTIEFACRTHEAQRAVVKMVRQMAETKSERKPRLKLVNQWGSWTNRNDLPQRSIDSVIIDPKQKKRIVDDLRTFLAAEKRYVDLAIPYHRGYMFHGPPGGGKTSLAKALATEFGMDMWYVSLSDLKEESSLLSLLSDVSPRSILLLEDIDTIKIAKDRDSSEQGKLSTSSLLNALDGVATPHGLITVMTTNHFELLDDALTRSGRMDVIEEIMPPTIREVQALYFRFYGTEFNAWMANKLPTGPLPLSQATVSEIFKRHLDNPHSAGVELSKKLEEIAYDRR